MIDSPPDVNTFLEHAESEFSQTSHALNSPCTENGIRDHVGISDDDDHVLPFLRGGF